MRTSIAALLALCLASCAHVGVVDTQVASGKTNPQYIYVRPFVIDDAIFTGSQPGSEGEMAIRKSLAPAELARMIKVEMAKMAPSMVISDSQVPEEGWLIEGKFFLVDGGSRWGRAFSFQTPIGASKLAAHVTVTNAATGQVLYAFDIAGGSSITGQFGSVSAGGLGHNSIFDYRNAAEEIYMALSTDPFRYGQRSRVVRYY